MQSRKVVGIPRRRQMMLQRAAVETLEARLQLSVSVLNYRNDIISSGVNSNETQLTPTNVTVGQFGKLYSTTVDGQIYGEPLIDTSVNITAGVNTTAGAVGNHDVAYVVTQNDSVYAIDASPTGGQVLWMRSFLNTANPTGDVNNTLGATKIIPLSYEDTGVSDIAPSIGITSTPVIDLANNAIYCEVRTKETVGGVTTFVQRVHALSLANGTDVCTPYLIGATTYINGNYTNNTQIYVYGDGDGSTTDPYNGTGKQVVQFNSLREAQRTPLSLVNNRLYIAYASLGDNGPYHGFVLTWDVSNLASKGLVLNGVLCTSPNDGDAGIWQGGGQLVFDPDEANTFYFATGNGSGGAPTVGSNGLPTDANYNEAVVKAVIDSSSSPTNQNPNGWGLKVTSFFIPYNVAAMDAADSDFGSGAPLILPDSAGIPGHPHLLVTGGKDGRIFLLDRDNLGGYNAVNDNALNAVTNKSGNKTAPFLISGQLSTATYFNGKLYVVSGYNGPAESYSVTSDGQIAPSSETILSNFGFAPGSPSISSDGASNGILWVSDRNTNELHAYSTDSLSTELWNSAQAAGGADDPGALIKFESPTIANGEVYLGTSDALVVYGLLQPPTAAPVSPVLAATTLSGSSVNLTWTDSTQAPNKPTQYDIYDSTDDSNFTQVAVAAAGSTSTAIGDLNPDTPYYFRIQGVNSKGSSKNSNVVSATTNDEAGYINQSGGFAGAASLFQLNGAAAFTGSDLQLTTLKGGEAASAYYTIPVDDTGFTTSFTFESTKDEATASGFTFTLQNSALSALGGTGSGLGYSGIPDSVAIKFDLANSAGTTADSTGLYTDGADPVTAAGNIDLSGTKINFHNGDTFLATLSYDGATLTETITDTDTSASVTEKYTINIPSVIGAGEAYAGFTASTGSFSALQEIETWTYNSSAASSPNPPTGLGATPASATSVTLDWTANSNSETGYHLERATDAAFTENVVTQTLPATGALYVDSAVGLAPGDTFYYRLSAFNLAGDSGYSNVASVSIPVAPPKPTLQSITFVSSTEIDMTWQDNAGHAAEGYQILGAVNYGAFNVLVTLPPTSRAAPSAYGWAATGLIPGDHYEFHIEAFNVSGHNDFAGVNANTLPAAPSVVATPGNASVTLAWGAINGAITYNIYRSLTSGGEGSTPYATGITTTSYTDTAVKNGVPYFYTVAAVNINATDEPNLPSQSAASAEASATPVAATTGTLLTTSTTIGAPPLGGSSSYSNGVYTLNGSGSDIYNSSDQFQFDSTSVTGNATIVAQVTSITNTHNWAKAAVMFRASTAANSAFADIVVTPAGYVDFQWRSSTGAKAQESTILVGHKSPLFLKMVRAGNTFTGYYSSNGTTWNQVGQATVAMASAVDVGLALTSLNTKKMCTATFANVSITQP